MREFKIKDLPYTFVAFNTIGDGSCLLHSILYCFNKKYRNASFIEKRRIVYNLRRQFSKLLLEKDKENKTYYESLSRGEIKELSKVLNNFDVNVMCRHLSSSRWLDIFYLELLSNHLNVDILIYDQYRGTFYQTGDLEMYHKGRNTIFINYQNEMHFEAMGIKLDKVETFFRPDCSIIQEIKKKFYSRN